MIGGPVAVGGSPQSPDFHLLGGGAATVDCNIAGRQGVGRRGLKLLLSLSSSRQQRAPSINNRHIPLHSLLQPPPPPPTPRDRMATDKSFTFAELKELNGKTNLHLLIDGKGE